MGTLAFFPWMHIRERVTAPGFELAPYSRGVSPGGAGASEQSTIDTLLGPYREAPQGPVRKATILRLEGKGLLDDMSDEEADRVLLFGELVAFSGLAARRFFDQLSYSSRESFRLIVQRFVDAGSGMTVVSRRRDGRSMTVVSKSAMLILKPYHVPPARAAELDVPLLDALLRRATRDDWGEIEEAIAGFNSANTDSPDVREESEAVALLGALERVLGLRGGDEHELADAFRAAVVPKETVQPVECSRISDSARRKAYEAYSSLREAWVRDFFRLRGDHAHGKLTPRYKSLWSLREHLLLATFVLPLVVKARLVRDGEYAWTDEDLGHVEAFEQLISLDPFASSDDERQNDRHARTWSRILSDWKLQVAVERWISERETPADSPPEIVETSSGHEQS